MVFLLIDGTLAGPIQSRHGNIGNEGVLKNSQKLKKNLDKINPLIKILLRLEVRFV